ncbi:hypothetical protein ACIA58_36660 [Kribbella sp. NPDC051586]|uniref:hypothetical protein n=1 Tax=Kribbella sp. NPDC051586 TaxID=3364118 RepID=UPI0037895EAF
MEYRTVTANQARAEYVAKCNEIIEIESVLSYLDNAIRTCPGLARPVYSQHDAMMNVIWSPEMWQLLDLYREAFNRRLDLYAARDYAYAVWQTASAADSAAGTYVPTAVKKR